jgi:hypothetical protein
LTDHRYTGYNITMNNFIVAGVLVFLASTYLGYRLYRDMSVALEAKAIHEKMKKDNFWTNREDFEEEFLHD